MTVAVEEKIQARTASSLLEVTWTDPVTGCKGFLVIDRLVRGVCSGGLRMRKGCTLEEVRGLAQGMTLKEGLHYRPNSKASVPCSRPIGPWAKTLVCSKSSSTR